MPTHRTPEEDAAPRVACHESRPGRAVFTEEGNPDAWIATDLAVGLER
ncbi:MAG: hypothetical protein ABEH77_04310 [Halobacteriaceae archaeon]